MRKSAQTRKSFKNHTVGFTLVELIVVISIIAILAVVVAIIINPFEIMRRGRDADRLAHLSQLQQAIAVAVQESTATAAETLCVGTSVPCSGPSTGSRASNGTGWVKVDLSAQQTVSFATLPVDPTNSTAYHYTYCSDGVGWEINTVLESVRESAKMSGDGGNEDNRYEVGSSLTLIAASAGSCTY